MAVYICFGSNEHSETVEVVIMVLRQNHMTNRATL